jgi:homoserine O-acetyltransferase/O-succinyltransferase
MLALEHDIETRSDGVGLVQTHYAHWDEPLRLQSGAQLSAWTLAYETYGTLNARRDNAILVMHALSGDAHVAGRHHPTDRKPGWWDALIGPGRGLDTDRYFVICANVLGGCRGSTGPSSIDPQTDRPFGLRFPIVTIPDMVDVQVRLLDRLGIDHLHATIGGSMGGMQVLELAINHPDRVRLAIALATTARHSAQQIAWNHIGRQAIMRDPNWCGGDYYGSEPPAAGLAVARMVGHVTYLSEERLDWRFGRALQAQNAIGYSFDTEFAVESYLNYQGASFVDRFDANSYLYITRALDYYNASDGFPSLTAAFEQARSRFLIASFESDWLYPAHNSEALVNAIQSAGRDVDYLTLPSQLGHDAFLLESDQLNPIVAEALATT